MVMIGKVKIKKVDLPNVFSIREDILNKAKGAVGKDDQYGAPEDNFQQIADLWNQVFDHEFDKKDVAIALLLVKVARIYGSVKNNDDNWVDIAGYAACGAEVASR